MRTIHVVAIESASSGDVDWYSREVDAKLAYETAIATIDYIGHDINRWSFEIPEGTHRHQITAEADRQMWELDYTKIEGRPA